MDGIAYIQWNIDAREAAGLQPIPYSCKHSRLALSLIFPSFIHLPLSVLLILFLCNPVHHLTPADPESKAPTKSPKPRKPKKVTDLKDANSNADAASMMSRSSFGSHIQLLKDKMKSNSKKEAMVSSLKRRDILSIDG